MELERRMMLRSSTGRTGVMREYDMQGMENGVKGMDKM